MNGHRQNTNTRIITQDRGKQDRNKNEEGEAREDETIVSYNEDRGSQGPGDTGRWAVCIHVRCNDV